MDTLREKLESPRFLVGVELVSIRGSMSEATAVRVRSLATQLVDRPEVDWISITDNAGGNPQLHPQALGKPILYAGKEVVIHLTCKDLNRNALESAAWQLDSEGFHNVLAMTGDYPVGGSGGRAKPVFDLDSVGLIAMLDRMNRGFDDKHLRTSFCIGAVTSNTKLREGEVVPQYLKLKKKIECGAHFVINQVGFDARKARELRRWMERHGIGRTPLVGNVYVLTARAARLFAGGRVAGIVVTPELLDACERAGRSADGGKAFFREFAAKQLAVFRGLGYRGAYLGGIHDLATVERVLEIERTFAPDDWKSFAREIAYGRPGEFFAYPDEVEAPVTGRVAPRATSRGAPRPVASRVRRAGFLYAFSRWTHGLMFTPGTLLSRWGARIAARSRDPAQGPPPLRALERATKAALFRCKDCGDCALPDVAFLCPESQCAKNQRNGPCGGTREGRCEVDGYGECIWLRAYERLKAGGAELTLLDHAPVVQNQALRGTSSWANTWLGRDHFGRAASETHPAPSHPAPGLPLPDAKSPEEPPPTTRHPPTLATRDHASS
ncbi:MAG TPA: methylenetetrahydrofolate reductase C-terminal domain-containing protein [Gemmatimonadales bacterium]|nr:methylenetetrahydrofolate reductase C-terminal domain-containing protein [Gemmatimonadales bacterium]